MTQTRDPLTGQMFIDGSAQVRASGQPGTLETRTFTIGSDTDCFTNKAAPLAAEIIGATFSAGSKRCRLTWHSEQGGVPFAAAVAVALNAGNAGTAVSRLTYVDVSVGDVATTDTRQRFLSINNPVIEYNLEGTDSTIDDIFVGGYLADGTGAVPVYISVEVW